MAAFNFDGGNLADVLFFNVTKEEITNLEGTSDLEAFLGVNQVVFGEAEFSTTRSFDFNTISFNFMGNGTNWFFLSLQRFKSKLLFVVDNFSVFMEAGNWDWGPNVTSWGETSRWGSSGKSSKLFREEKATVAQLGETLGNGEGGIAAPGSVLGECEATSIETVDKGYNVGSEVVDAGQCIESEPHGRVGGWGGGKSITTILIAPASNLDGICANGRERWGVTG